MLFWGGAVKIGAISALGSEGGVSANAYPAVNQLATSTQALSRYSSRLREGPSTHFLFCYIIGGPSKDWNRSRSNSLNSFKGGYMGDAIAK